jgi:hypothetical protein
MAIEAQSGIKPLWLKILRWSARIIAIILIALYLFIRIYDSIRGRPTGASPLQASDYLHYALVALYIIGMIIGLWREGLGGLISLVFMIINIVILQTEYPTNLIFLYVMLLPSILYILSWYFHRKLVRQQSK